MGNIRMSGGYRLHGLLYPLFFFSFRSYATISNEEVGTVLVNADKYSRQTGVLKM